MNKKLTKLLSVFVIAGAIGTGAAIGLTGCGHKHTAGEEWQKDDTSHWHNCTADDGEQLDKADHIYESDDDTTCDTCGYKRTVTYSITYAGVDGINGTNSNPTSYNTESGAITLAAVEKAGYTFDGWYNSANEKVTTIAAGTKGNIALTAKWTANEYTVTFKADGTQVGEVFKYTVENKTVTAPAVPEKAGYTGVWETYNLNELGNKEVNAVYTANEYTVTFKADGAQVGEVLKYTVENKTVTAPAVPAKAGYTGVWETYNLDELGNKEVNAVYTAIEYNVTFKADGTQVGEVLKYTVENKNITAPAVPAKAGYTGAWGTYNLDELGNKEVNAVYTANEYTVTFKADGVQVGEVLKYTVENKNITAPAVPEKAGYTGAWETYNLDELGNKEVNAVYTVIPYTITYEGLDGITGTNSNVTEYNVESAITLAPVAKDGLYFAGWTNAEGKKVTSIAKGTTGNLTLTANWMTITEISTAEEFNAFRTNATPSGAYVLTADIDLAGVTLDATTVKLTSDVIFDGQGHVIKNAVYANATAKTGILCASIQDSTVTNVKFLGCATTSTNESAAILAGLVNGASTLSKIEFNSCSVVSGNYGGLLFARNDAGNGNITIEEITAKNGCSVHCAQYGGLVMGDMQNSTKVSFKNLDLAGELKGSSGNGSFIAGRTRGGGTSEVTVENAVLNVQVPVANSIGIFSGNGDLAKLTVKNVLITGSNIANLYQANKAPKAEDITGLYTVSVVTVDKATATGENTVAFLKDTLGFDFTNVWTAEGENNAKYRLTAASTNVKSADAVIEAVKLSTSNVKVRFKKGEEFTAEGLNVMGAYSDGVQLVLNAGEGYTVDSTAFNKEAAGEYTITVKSVEDETKTATYNVTVVEEVGFEIIDNHMDHVYLVGDSLDTANLVVKSIWSDGVKEKLAASEYAIDATSYDMTAAGTYQVSITHGTYAAQTVTINVLNSIPQVVNGKVYVNVSATHDGANGALVKGVETFTSVKDAINFYETIGYASEVTKVIYVGEGTYEDKITTALDNLVLIGEGADKSVMTYSAVESTVDPVTGAMYGLKCATLQVDGEGFRAYNIAIRNDFDYKNDNKKEASPQGLALTVNGDQAVLQNVYLYGNQDTLYLKSGRTYFKDSKIDGNIDFIFGEATGLAYFDTCTIKAINKSNNQEANNGYVTAMKADESNKPNYGYIFANCNFTDDGTLLAGSMSLGRPWGKSATVAYISCEFSAAYSTAAYDGKTKSRWFDMSGNLPQNADFCEYNSTGAGAITEAVTGGRILTADEAANYTKTNIFAATNGKCTWSAAWDCDAAVTALAELTGAKVTATELYASATEISVEAGKTAELWLGVAPWNATDKEVTVTVADETVATWANGVLTGVKKGTTTITVSKAGLTDKVVTVTVTAGAAVTTNTYTYDFAAIDASTGTPVDGKAGQTLLTAGSFTGVNAFLSVVDGGTITHRADGGKAFIEIKNDSLSVAFEGTGTITLQYASTGSNNKSRIGLKAADGTFIAPDSVPAGVTAVAEAEAGSYEVLGTATVELTFTITAPGVYTITSPSTVTGRGCRLLGVTMVDNVVEG